MEWKLIKDGTPDDDREVLLAVQGTDIPIQAYYSHRQGAWFGSFEVRDNMKNGRVDDAMLIWEDEITHWMELPKKPELVNQPAGGALNMNIDPNIKSEEEVKGDQAEEVQQEQATEESAEEGNTEG